MTIDRRSLILGASTLATLGATAVAESETQETKNLPKERVQGIGGFFFRSLDPKALAAWYERNLGINLTPRDYNQSVWQQAAGPTAFQPFPMDSKYFGSAQHSWMLNFRVANLDAIVAQLRASNIAVDVDTQVYPNGRFARLHDPEGNSVELWQPSSTNPHAQ
jgi:glyoxylase I family protein